MFEDNFLDLPSAAFQCGCFFVPNHKIPLAPQKSILPLRKANYQIEIINGLAYVTLVQQYENNAAQFLQTLYKFPISPNACIHKFSATFSKRRMEGVVRQKEQAKKEYTEAVGQGKKAAYGEVDPGNKDIMIMKIGNIDANQKVTIQISYIEEMEISLNTFYKFTLPAKNSPKYFSCISKQQFAQSFRKKALIGQVQFEWDFKMTLRSARKILAYQSSNHQLNASFTNDTSTQISLTFQKGATLDSDFIFNYTTQEFQLPSYTLGRTDLGSTVMVSFIPKFCNLNLEDAKKQALKSNEFETDMDSARGEYIFLLDRSGSMGGKRITKAKEALILFLKSLPIDSYFNVVSFGSKFQLINKYSQKNSTQSIDKAIQNVQKMSADMGGTQVEQPLRTIFKSQIKEGYPKLIYLLTDGQVKDTQSVIDIVRRNVRYSRVHTIGIGSGASQELIKGCAEKGKGQYIFIQDNEKPAEKIIQLLNDTLSAVISKVELHYDKELVQSVVPYPNSMPYILKGQVANFYLTFHGQLDKNTFISFGYKDSQNNMPFKGEIQINPESTSYAFVDIMGHYKEIKTLEEAEEDNTYWTSAVKSTKNKDKIVQMSLKYQILSKYTSFLCVEKEVVDGKYQQVKSKGQIFVQIKDKIQDEHQPAIDFSLKSNKNCSFDYFTAKPHAYQAYSQPPPLPQPTIPSGLLPPPMLHLPQPLIPTGLPPPLTPMLHLPPPINFILPPPVPFLGLPPPLPGTTFGNSSSFFGDQLILLSHLPQLPPPICQLPPPPPPPPSPPPLRSTPPLPPPPSALDDRDWMKRLLLDEIKSPPLAKLRLARVQRDLPPPPPSFGSVPRHLPPPPPPPYLSPSQLLPPSSQLSYLKPSPSQGKAINKSLFAQDLCQFDAINDFSNFQAVQMQTSPAKQQVNSLDPLGIFEEFSPPKQKKIQDPFDIFQIQIQQSQKNSFDQDLIQYKAPGSVSFKKNYSIDEIVKQQDFQGFWSNLDIICSLYGKQLAESIRQKADLTAIITFLVWKWIEKNHGGKQYQLIIKKAVNWLKKQVKFTDYQQQFRKNISLNLLS